MLVITTHLAERTDRAVYSFTIKNKEKYITKQSTKMGGAPIGIAEKLA